MYTLFWHSPFRGQHQMTVLGQDQAILYTWDNPTGNRTLLWNVYNGKKSQESEIDITKVCYDRYHQMYVFCNWYHHYLLELFLPMSVRIGITNICYNWYRLVNINW